MPTDPGDIATGAVITETYLDRMRAFALWAGTGSTSSPASWQSFSATLTQSGSVSMSTNSCKYAGFGDMVVVIGKLIANAAGTATNDIVVSGLPVGIVADRLSGIALFQDASTGNNYISGCFMSTTTSFRQYSSGTTAALGNTGSLFVHAIASGDALWFTLIGERA